ncbi:aldehyde dehydrogenase (NAD(P)(+)) ALD5 [Sugiyamaella lignohabitans]|uniref:Aldehyde dehydrogenase (NAD(P)(+)) ALD5 n=1 Tax=Sugiyamaella lignohabitans TaxID=796027 RepID=A0A161HKN3_9ASCO|nr:aldehyde dehydrogenase (NAD(P)(+)) ALD5 [Sugiyamaella lignohabitans]ANB13617.1 aldehyde dehydrogenase (NAD(P)(+)) ALD5 [Sugiyamaella lignohabitans]
MSLPLEVKLTAPSGKSFELPTGLFINNEFVYPQDKTSTITVLDPDTGKIITDVYAAKEEDVDIAVKAARAAYKKGWRHNQSRGDLLYKLSELITKNAEVLATIEAWDTGKSYSAESYGNIVAGALTYKYYAGWADKLGGKTIDVGENKFAYTLHEPLGVCGQIIPWNYPFLMKAWKIGAAVATGNTVVLKTAENTPLSALYFAKLVVEAGFPPGVINLFTGLGPVAGAHLASHLDVDKIAFTGSTVVGKQIMKYAASNLKNITLECGGKSPMIIFDDADLEKAAIHAHSALMGNQGQTCTAMSRYYVHEAVYDKFVELYKQQVLTKSKVGHPFDEDTFQGPQVSEVQQKRVLGYIESGKSEGAKVVIGGNVPKSLSNGFFVEPTIFSDVTDDMKIMREEIFGPVASITKFTDEHDVVQRANDSSYGLGASIFTKDLQRAHRVARDLESGQVWINSGNDSDYRIPFGGYKQSGIGRELGEYGIQIYTQVKAVHVNLN